MEKGKSSINERIINWHRERYHGPCNDIALLSEEAKEFWEATEPAHMLQEYCDFKFVWEGVKWRYNSEVYMSPVDLEITAHNFNIISEWAEQQLVEMYDRLWFTDYRNDGLKEAALVLVLEANELKPLEPVDGKIPKGDKYESPLPKIRELLNGTKNNIL